MKKDRCFAFDKKMHIIPSFLLSKVFNELIKNQNKAFSDCFSFNYKFVKIKTPFYIPN